MITSLLGQPHRVGHYHTACFHGVKSGSKISPIWPCGSSGGRWDREGLYGVLGYPFPGLLFRGSRLPLELSSVGALGRFWVGRFGSTPSRIQERHSGKPGRASPPVLRPLAFCLIRSTVQSPSGLVCCVKGRAV